ncbi:hypothetical protein EfmAA96_30980 (plasmid) [Enterococcus faecium]|nr:hypothetical protein EfmAA96_30980 [Enterococcus faecium]
MDNNSKNNIASAFIKVKIKTDLVLQTAIEEFLNGGSLAGKISQLYICDLLVHGYEQNNNIDSVELREKVLRSIIDKSIE